MQLPKTYDKIPAYSGQDPRYVTESFASIHDFGVRSMVDFIIFAQIPDVKKNTDCGL